MFVDAEFDACTSMIGTRIQSREHMRSARGPESLAKTILLPRP